jgi:hypothetical protein
MSAAGFGVSTAMVDVAGRETIRLLISKATGIGRISGLIQEAGVSPSQDVRVLWLYFVSHAA